MLSQNRTHDEMSCNDQVIEFPANHEFVTLGFVFVGLGLAVCVAALSTLLWFYETPVIRVSQRELMVTYILGFFILNLSGVARLMNAAPPFKDSFCVWQLWLVNIPLTVIFSVLGAKEFKTWKIRKATKRLRSFKCKLQFAFVYVFVASFVMMVILVFNTVFQAPFVDPCHNFECVMSNAATFWIATIFLFAQMAGVLVLAWKDRNLGRVGGEGVTIVLNCAFVFAFFVAVFISFVRNPKSKSLQNSSNKANALEGFITYLLCFCATTASLGSLMWTKVRFVNLNNEQILQLFIEQPQHGSMRESVRQLKRRLKSSKTPSSQFASAEKQEHLVQA